MSSYLNVLILACPKLPGVNDADVHLGKLDASMIAWVLNDQEDDYSRK
jgi:hypothetical protein